MDQTTRPDGFNADHNALTSSVPRCLDKPLNEQNTMTA